jgi:hypothetical protein
MKKINFLIVMMLVSILTSQINAATPLAEAKSFETVILKLNCSGFNVTGTGTSEMSVGTEPNNWVASTGAEWTSYNCFPANITSVPHIKQAVQFGSTTTGTGLATTPALDLSPSTGKTTRVRISATAGSNKTGSLTVKLNGNTIGTISAATFGATYYTFEYDITASGTSASILSFEHSRVEEAGNIYVNDITVYKTPNILLSLNCSVFTTNASTEMSVATAPHNWTAAIGANPAVSEFMYAQGTSTNAYGKAVRFGATSGNIKVGKITTNDMDLSSSGDYKTKMYIELYMTTVDVGTKLNMSVDNGEIQWTFDPKTDNGGNPVTPATWIAYDTEIIGGTSASKLTLSHTRNEIETTCIYMRNLKIYKEYTGPTTVKENFMNNSIKLYPNPCYNELYTDADYLSVINLTGNSIIQTKVNNGRINVSSLPSGAYFVHCYDKDGNKSVHKIIKN